MKIGKWFKPWMKIKSNWKWETVNIVEEDGSFYTKSWNKFNLGDQVEWFKNR